WGDWEGLPCCPANNQLMPTRDRSHCDAVTKSSCTSLFTTSVDNRCEWFNQRCIFGDQRSLLLDHPDGFLCTPEARHLACGGVCCLPSGWPPLFNFFYSEGHIFDFLP